MTEKIQYLIGEAKKNSRNKGTSFASVWDMMELFTDPIAAIPEVKERVNRFNRVVTDALKGSALVDLGAGYPTSELIKFLQSAALGEYIAVDRYVDPGKGPVSINLPNAKVKTYQEDMLEFAIKLSPDSVNFMLNGIDLTIIGLEKYHKVLAQTILDKTKRGGVILTCNSTVSRYLLNSTLSTQVKVLDWSEDDHKKSHFGSEMDTYIFQKL